MFILQIPLYNCKVKIINPTKESDVIVRELHHFQTIESVSALRLKLNDDFGSMFLVLKILMLVILKENNTWKYGWWLQMI